MDNDVVYGMAVHYYDEDDIKVNKLPSNVRTSASTTTPAKPVKLTEEEEKRAREEAIKRLAEEHTLCSRKSRHGQRKRLQR